MAGGVRLRVSDRSGYRGNRRDVLAVITFSQSDVAVRLQGGREVRPTHET